MSSAQKPTPADLDPPLTKANDEELAFPEDFDDSLATRISINDSVF
jgi:hypothetical protein